MMPGVALPAAALLGSVLFSAVPGAGVAQQIVVPQQIAIQECSVHAHGPDSDGDGLVDACELALASTFAPLLMVRTGGCNVEAGAEAARLGGGYFHAVQRVGGRVRIAYLPAYFHDCGWQDVRCVIPLVNCAPHAGDSEFIVVEVEPDVNERSWRVAGVFLSAHCFGRGSRSCRWYRDAELRRFEWHGAAPVVWVADGRNATYPSWQACNAGHRTMDTCARHDGSFRFPVSADRNIGSRSRPAWPGGCVGGSELDSTAVDAERVECFWVADVAFRGWQPGGRGVTAYERYLREVAGF